MFRRGNLYWLVYLFQLAVLLVIVGNLSSCGKIKVDDVTVKHEISIDAETLDRIQVICEDNSTTNEETLNCIDQLINAYNKEKNNGN